MARFCDFADLARIVRRSGGIGRGRNEWRLWQGEAVATAAKVQKPNVSGRVVFDTFPYTPFSSCNRPPEICFASTEDVFAHVLTSAVLDAIEYTSEGPYIFADRAKSGVYLSGWRRSRDFPCEILSLRRSFSNQKEQRVAFSGCYVPERRYTPNISCYRGVHR